MTDPDKPTPGDEPASRDRDTARGDEAHDKQTVAGDNGPILPFNQNGTGYAIP